MDGMEYFGFRKFGSFVFALHISYCTLFIVDFPPRLIASEASPSHQVSSPMHRTNRPRLLSNPTLNKISNP